MKNIKDFKEDNNTKKIKELAQWYIKLGLIGGCLDKEGRLRLSKEEYENWQ